MRTVVVHPVGAGDLDLDILGHPHAQRGVLQALKEDELAHRVQAGREEEVFDALFWTGAGQRRRSRFPASPLRQVFEALVAVGGAGCVTLVLCGSSSGRGPSRGATDLAAFLLEEALNREGLRRRIADEFGATVELRPLYGLNLLEENTVPRLVGHLRGQCGIESADAVVVNGINGSNAFLTGVMGAVDGFGRDWQLASCAGADRVPARLTTWEHGGETVRAALLALGYVEEASAHEEPLDGARAPGGAEISELEAALERFANSPGHLTGTDLARLLRLDLARGDIAAGLIARTWIREHYAELLDAERRAPADGELPPPVFDRGDDGRLGPRIGEARRRVDNGDTTPSTVWLAGTGWINDIGKAATHGLASPTASEFERLWNHADLAGALPPQIQGPHSGPVLHIVPIGAWTQAPTPVERVLTNPPHPQLLRSVPGGMLDGAELDVEFLLLHSTDERSARAAATTVARANACAPHPGWLQRGDRSTAAADYGDGDENVGSGAIGKSVNGIVGRRLDTAHPRAVVVVATGQKPVFLAALHTARAWCDERGVPLFLQSFVDPGRGIDRPGPQFHRVAVGERTRRALLRAARASLGRLNLATAARALAAAGPRAAEYSAMCQQLRDELGEAATAKRMDRYATVFVDFLNVLIEHHCGPGAVDPRVATMVAEIFKHADGQKGKFVPDPGSGRLSDPKSAGPLRFEELEAADCVLLLRDVRDGLVVTHGAAAVPGALASALGNRGVTTRGGFGYTGLIIALRDRLERTLSGGRAPASARKLPRAPQRERSSRGRTAAPARWKAPPQAVTGWKERFDMVWAFCAEGPETEEERR